MKDIIPKAILMCQLIFFFLSLMWLSEPVPNACVTVIALRVRPKERDRAEHNQKVTWKKNCLFFIKNVGNQMHHTFFLSALMSDLW